MEFVIEYLGEIVLLIVSGFLCVFGKKESASKLWKQRTKLRTKQEKKVQKDVSKLKKDFEILEEMKNAKP